MASSRFYSADHGLRLGRWLTMKFPVLKTCLCRVGVLVPARVIHYLNGLLNYLNIGRWFHDRKLRVPVRCASRESLYDEVAKFVQEPAVYLEFGVFKGVTLRYWTKLLKHPDSFFHGFDSFIGLPEPWGHFVDKEYFNIAGAMPRFEDQRVRLFKGWFTDTLPGYLRDFRPPPSRVIHLDADLYSSTIFVLRQLRPHLQPGTILIFDEFFDREQELKAFTEFMDDEKMAVECLAASQSLSQAAFRITALPSASAAARPGG